MLPEESGRADSLRDGLRERGWVEGRNIAIEWRWARGNTERYTDLAADLVRLKVDVIVAASNAAVGAAQKATTTIPIVMINPTDPVGLGFVRSLARPGGNTTGLTNVSLELQGKRLQLLKQALPKLARLGILWDPAERGRREQVKEVEVAAASAVSHVRLVEMRSVDDTGRAFAAMAGDGIDAVIAVASAMLFAQRAQIAQHAVKHRLPTMFPAREYAEAGGFLAYGTDFNHLHRRAAHFVDRILNGAKPGDLPVEQPSKFELVINLRTAKALGLKVPPSLLLQADTVIE